ncbi:MAG: LLM class F420-dependent oxidoreductase [Sphingomonadales bacterium]|nr:MAG: LLM class F420-dependent oxidoreductase [Sphingomonadales bacterium]
MAVKLGRVGVWAMELRSGGKEAGARAAAEAEKLGYGAIWTPGGIDDQVLGDVDNLLDATSTAVIGTGIINVWKQPAEDVGAWFAPQSADRKARTMLGLGISHGPLIGDSYGKPIENMSAYLDRLDKAGVPKGNRCLAALGPKMLDLAADRTAGSHPYLVPVEHAAVARKRMGPDALLAPEVGVVLETDPDKARAMARDAVSFYLTLPNYVNNWRRLGYSEEDVKGSDKLIDALFAWGEPKKIAERINAHLDAGADHVCIQVIRADMMNVTAPPVDEWRTLAKALF